MNFGMFLLMQSPSARSSQEIYARAIDLAQAAEALGFHNVWLAEHHFSTYGYLSRPAQLATYIAAKTTRIRVGTPVTVHYMPGETHRVVKRVVVRDIDEIDVDDDDDDD